MWSIFDRWLARLQLSFNTLLSSLSIFKTVQTETVQESVNQKWNVSKTRLNPYNFEIVLLDHGLYRTLSDTLRIEYAKLWMSLINGDECGIQESWDSLLGHGSDAESDTEMNTKTGECDLYLKSSKKKIDYHRLFASMITGRSWQVISNDESQQIETSSEATSNTFTLKDSLNSTKSSNALLALSKPRTKHEQDLLSNNANSNFVIAVTDILSRIPREIVLLVKTNDLLRCVDGALCGSLKLPCSKGGSTDELSDKSLDGGNKDGAYSETVIRTLSHIGRYSSRARREFEIAALVSERGYGYLCYKEYWNLEYIYLMFRMRLLVAVMWLWWNRA